MLGASKCKKYNTGLYIDADTILYCLVPANGIKNTILGYMYIDADTVLYCLAPTNGKTKEYHTVF